MQRTKAALDSLIHLVLERGVAVRDIGWLRAAAAERPERVGVSACRCGYRHSSAESDRGTEHDFLDQQWSFVGVNIPIVRWFYWLCLGQKAAMLTPTKNPA